LAVAGKMNDARRTGYVERGTVAERGDLEDRRRAEHPLRQREADEPDGRKPDAEHLLVLGFRLAPSHLRVELVHAHRYPLFAAQALGEADVIDVRVGEHERSNVGERAAHRCELVREIVPIAGGSSVHDRDLAALLEPIRLDKTRTDAMMPWFDTH